MAMNMNGMKAVLFEFRLDWEGCSRGNRLAVEGPRAASLQTKLLCCRVLLLLLQQLLGCYRGCREGSGKDFHKKSVGLPKLD